MFSISIVAEISLDSTKMNYKLILASGVATWGPSVGHRTYFTSYILILHINILENSSFIPIEFLIFILLALLKFSILV